MKTETEEICECGHKNRHHSLSGECLIYIDGTDEYCLCTQFRPKKNDDSQNGTQEKSTSDGFDKEPEQQGRNSAGSDIQEKILKVSTLKQTQ